jgi:hypothetical protein
MSSPKDYCSKGLKEIHSSNLHYLVQESPSSMYIRNKFLKNALMASESPSTKVQQLDYRVNMLESQTTDLENQLKTKDLQLSESKDTIKLLENKLERAESRVQ